MNAEALANVDLFSTLDTKELQLLARNCQERTYAPGTTLFNQGDMGVGLYIIQKGHVRITQAIHPDRAEEELGVCGPNDILGEMALLDELPRSATAVALDDVTAQLLPVWEFRGVLRMHPEIGLKLLGVLSRRLRKAEARAQL